MADAVLIVQLSATEADTGIYVLAVAARAIPEAASKAVATGSCTVNLFNIWWLLFTVLAILAMHRKFICALTYIAQKMAALEDGGGLASTTVGTMSAISYLKLSRPVIPDYAGMTKFWAMAA